MKSPQSQTIDLPPLSLRADVGAVDEASRTVPLIFSTGAPVERMDYWTGKRYREVLSMKPESIRLDRLNAGAPLLDAHSAWSVGDILGTVEPDSAKVEKGKATANVRFSKRETVEPIFQDVKDKIITSVSVGYRVFRFVETQGKNDEIPTREAIDWEPYEISLVPMPADTGARVRNGDKSLTNSCVIETRAAGEPVMEERQQSEFIVEPNPLADVPVKRTEVPAEPNDRDAGAISERDRINGIMQACRAARLPLTFQDKLINDNVALVRAQAMVFDELRKRDMDSHGTKPGGGPAAVITVGDDRFVHARNAIEGALLNRVAPQWFKMDDDARQYRGLTLLDIGRLFIQARGERTVGLSKMDLAGLALGINVRAGYHTSSDFALLLADVAGKTLRKAYEEAPQTFTAIARRVSLPDFKPVKRLQIGDAPQLLEVDEHGEFTRGTIGEGKEQFQLATYGRVFAITRKALVNDDTDAFSRIPMLFGRSARNLESNLVWAQILSNPTMGDGVALFHTSHNNIDPVGDAISIDAIGAGRAAMRLQTGVDGETLLNVMVRNLIVPPSLETVADQFVSTNLLANQTSQVNPFAGRLQVISEPRLETGIGSVAGSSIAWYLAASPDQLDMVEYGSLEGEEGPMVESRIGFDVDGLEVKCRHDFAAKVIDHRGFYKNHGDQSAT